MNVSANRLKNIESGQGTCSYMLANHSGHSQYREPIKIQGEGDRVDTRAGKRLQTGPSWLWFYL